MDISHLLESLNAAQREAVTADDKHVLVLAGAGSGKTRVLVHRIAWLLTTGQARPHNILALTFTNKAAQEMQHRIALLQKQGMGGLWTGTFHGIAHRLLRIHWETAQLPQTFQVLDSDDQLRKIKKVLKALKVDEKLYSAKTVQYFINKCKEEGLRAHHIENINNDRDIMQKTLFYQVYQENCEQTGTVDFAELLLRTFEMLQRNPELLQHYRSRFHFILVDEFQDTNSLQYRWLQQLAGEHNRLFVVGDDDQSIYGWRGARIENIQHFNQIFSGVNVVRLEQNYRSTGTILDAANALIEHNQRRLGKNLWTEDEIGEPIWVYNAYNEINEAEFVVERILASPYERDEMAILYRTSAQSRVFEDELRKQGIAYRIYGGMRFYERLEIKDVLAYLRLAVHPHDDDAFERIVNVPKRGIGERTVENLRQNALQVKQSLYQTALNTPLKGKAATAMQHFFQILDAIREKAAHFSLSDLVKYVITITGLVEHYKQEGKEEAQKRLENLDELIVAALAFEKSGKDGNDPLIAFLANAALESSMSQTSEHEKCVQLMTLHLAKGLEFNAVFLCGLEEDLFPHRNSIDEGNLEEERRLCYVGITRAKRQLFLCHSEARYRYGMRDFSRPSRFLAEIPARLMEYVRLPSRSAPLTLPRFEVGQRVRHLKYGEGFIVDFSGRGEFASVQVSFADCGTKWLVLSQSGLERLL